MATSNANKWIAGLGLAFTAGIALVVAVPAGLIFLFSAVFGGQQGGAGGYCTPGGGTNTVGGAPIYSGPWNNPLVGEVTSTYALRVHPVLGITQLHSGHDIAAPDGTAIRAAAGGVVTVAGPSTGGNSGYMVAIDHGGGIQTRYVHSWPEGIHVQVGERVEVNQHIADVGSSGNSTGPHLHFEVRVNGQPTEPVAFMAERGVRLGTDSPVDTEEGLKRASSTEDSQPDAPRSMRRADGVEFTPSAEQLHNLSLVIEHAQSRGESVQAQIIMVMTVLQESTGYMWANSSVPASLSLPHDRVGSDHDSVGLFQQRPSMGWGSVEQLMDPRHSATAFLEALHRVDGWEAMPLTLAADAVQRSAFPEAYAKWEPVATDLVTGSTGSTSLAATSRCPAPPLVAAPGQEADADALREATVTAVTSQLGGEYVPGGRQPGAWDDDGMVWWATTQAGFRGIPYVSAWTRGERVSSPAPGDLVVTGQRRDGAWDQVGIKAEGPYFFTVTTSGTAKLPIPSGAEFYDLTKATQP